jgi:hypothetical protein
MSALATGLAYCSNSQLMPRETQLEQGTSRSQRNFLDLQKRHETGRWRLWVDCDIIKWYRRNFHGDEKWWYGVLCASSKFLVTTAAPEFPRKLRWASHQEMSSRHKVSTRFSQVTICVMYTFIFVSTHYSNLFAIYRE